MIQVVAWWVEEKYNEFFTPNPSHVFTPPVYMKVKIKDERYIK